MGTWFAAVGLAIIALTAVGLLHMGWRMWRGNEEFEAGGSLGDQLTALLKRDRRGSQR
jgi:uncharacterized membrane protein YphA (DoxX/SURF4 family)